MYIKLQMNNFLKWHLDLLGPNGIYFALCNFRAQKSLDFQCPPLPMALEMDWPSPNHYPTSRAIYKQVD